RCWPLRPRPAQRWPPAQRRLSRAREASTTQVALATARSEKSARHQKAVRWLPAADAPPLPLLSTETSSAAPTAPPRRRKMLIRVTASGTCGGSTVTYAAVDEGTTDSAFPTP